MLVRIANWEDFDQAASCLIWVSAVCLDLFNRQLVFKIVGHLPYLSHMQNVLKSGILG